MNLYQIYIVWSYQVNKNPTTYIKTTLAVTNLENEFKSRKNLGRMVRMLNDLCDPLNSIVTIYGEEWEM